MKKIMLIHGPNLSLTGTREYNIYGQESLEDINNYIISFAKKLDLECDIFQTNFEGEIIDKLEYGQNHIEGIIINPGAYTHYSYAIRDSILASRLPCIEVHMSNIYAREEFRSKSVIAPVCVGQIAGFGKHSYTLAIQAIKDILS